MKTRWKILIAAGVALVLLGGSLLITAHYQPENAVAAYKKFLLAQGEKLDVSEFISPPVPAQSNSVDAVQKAFKMLAPSPEDNPDQMIMVAPGKAMPAWVQPEARGFDFTNSWEEFAAEISADQPAIDLLHQVLIRPFLNFQLDYRRGAKLLLPHLVPMKRATLTLDAAAVCEMHAGDTGAATTNILTILAFVRKDATETLLISHLVRLAMAAIAVSPTWDLLQTTNVTDAQLAALQSGWQDQDFLTDSEHAFEMERAWGMQAIEELRTNQASLNDYFGMSGMLRGSSSSSGVWRWIPGLESWTEGPRRAIGAAMWRSSWSYSDELNQLKSETIMLNAVRTMRTNRSQFYQADYEAMEKQLSSLKTSRAGSVFFRALKIPGLGGLFGGWRLDTVVRKSLRMETARRVVMTAIALKRFQLKNGKLPETLSALVPDYLSAVPIDVFSGKPLRYQLNGDGTFLLYSVGENGVDDGGDPLLETGASSNSRDWLNQHARDWVWPQPATAAEIRYFYAHPPK